MAIDRLRPRNLDGLLLAIQDRLRKLESRSRVTVGAGAGVYVLEVNAAGELTARHTGTGTVTVIATP